MSTLTGKRIVVTRAPHQSGELADLLRERGAVPLLYPCIDIAPPENLTAFNDAVKALVEGKFDWLVLTSTNTVLALQRAFDSLKINPTHFSTLQIAAVGAATAQAAETQLGLRVNGMPEDDYSAEALADSLRSLAGKRVLLPQSAIAESTLGANLSEMGALVTAVTAYRTIMGSGGVDLPALLKAGGVDAITLTSASTVTNLLWRLQNEGGDETLLAGCLLACIGPQTAAAARNQHLPVTVMPAEHTLHGLVTALENHYATISIGETE